MCGGSVTVLQRFARESLPGKAGVRKNGKSFDADSGCDKRERQRKTTGRHPVSFCKKVHVVKSLPLIQGDICGKVRLEPHYDCGKHQDAALHFKIGVDRMYVMKDVFAFARAVERHEKSMHTGKIFLSPMQWKAFAPESRPLVSFILQLGSRRINIAMATAGIHRYHHRLYRSARNKLLDLTWEGSGRHFWNFL